MNGLGGVMNRYVCLYRGKEFECEAETIIRARDKAVCHFRVKKHWEVTVVLVGVGSVGSADDVNGVVPYVHTATN